MKKLVSSLVLGLGLACSSALAAVVGVAGAIENGSTEDMVFGAVADTACTVTAFGSPAWSSPSLPASLSSGQSVTFGYANGTTGSMGSSAGGYFLRDAAVRGVIRGTSNNGGVASRLRAVSPVQGTSINGTIHYVTIWGPTLNNFGVVGATNFNWEIRHAISGAFIQSGTGEAVVPLNIFGSQQLVTYVTPTTPTELGSVFVSYSF